MFFKIEVETGEWSWFDVWCYLGANQFLWCDSSRTNHQPILLRCLCCWWFSSVCAQHISCSGVWRARYNCHLLLRSSVHHNPDCFSGSHILFYPGKMQHRFVSSVECRVLNLKNITVEHFINRKYFVFDAGLV